MTRNKLLSFLSAGGAADAFRRVVLGAQLGRIGTWGRGAIESIASFQVAEAAGAEQACLAALLQIEQLALWRRRAGGCDCGSFRTQPGIAAGRARGLAAIGCGARGRLHLQNRRKFATEPVYNHWDIVFIRYICEETMDRSSLEAAVAADISRLTHLIEQGWKTQSTEGLSSLHSIAAVTDRD